MPIKVSFHSKMCFIVSSVTCLCFTFMPLSGRFIFAHFKYDFAPLSLVVVQYADLHTCVMLKLEAVTYTEWTRGRPGLKVLQW